MFQLHGHSSALMLLGASNDFQGEFVGTSRTLSQGRTEELSNGSRVGEMKNVPSCGPSQCKQCAAYAAFGILSRCRTKFLESNGHTFRNLYHRRAMFPSYSNLTPPISLSSHSANQHNTADGVSKETFLYTSRRSTLDAMSIISPKNSPGVFEISSKSRSSIAVAIILRASEAVAEVRQISIRLSLSAMSVKRPCKIIGR